MNIKDNIIYNRLKQKLRRKIVHVHTCNAAVSSFLITLMQAYIIYIGCWPFNLLIEFSSKINERNTTKYILLLLFYHCWLHSQSVQPLVFKALNTSSWKDFWSKGDSSHLENSPSASKILDSGTVQREGLRGFIPPLFARIKINETKNNLTKVTEWKIAKNPWFESDQSELLAKTIMRK